MEDLRQLREALRSGFRPAEPSSPTHYDVRRELEPLEERIAAFGEEVRQSAGALVQEVQFLTARLGQAESPNHAQRRVRPGPPQFYGDLGVDMVRDSGPGDRGRPSRWSETGPGAKTIRDRAGSVPQVRSAPILESRWPPTDAWSADLREQVGAATSSRDRRGHWEEEEEGLGLRMATGAISPSSSDGWPLTPMAQPVGWAAAAGPPHEDLARQRERLEVFDGAKAWEAERAALQRQVAQLQDSLERAEHELGTRPTPRLAQQLRNRVLELERGANPEHEARRKVADTRELIRQDRVRHAVDKRRASQGFARLREVSREELERSVVAVCSALGVADLQEAEVAAKRLTSVVEDEVPKLEDFASKVCALVQSARGVPCSPAGALQELRAWLQKAGSQGGSSWESAAASRRFRSRLQAVLERGAEKDPWPPVGEPPSEDSILQRLSELVQEERWSHTLWQQAEQEISERPAAPAPYLAAILKHFMQLFEVKSVKGCLPAMTTLYTRLGELSTLHGAVRDRLQLRPPGRGNPSVAETMAALPRLEVPAHHARSGTLPVRSRLGSRT